MRKRSLEMCLSNTQAVPEHTRIVAVPEFTAPVVGRLLDAPFLLDYSLPENHVEVVVDQDETQKPCPRSMIEGTVREHDFPPLRGPLRPPL